MFAIAITGPDDFRETVMVGWDEYTIGRAGHNDLVLPHDSVAMAHVRIFARGAELVIHPVADASIDGEKLGSPRKIAAGARVRVGEYLLVFSWVTDERLELGEIERGLIDVIERDRDEASRLVYADWLDEQGQAVRAEFLRLEQARLAVGYSDDRKRMDMGLRMRELASAIDPAWRARLARPFVVDCRKRCGRTWGDLEPTDRERIRRCPECNYDVQYCFTEQEQRPPDALYAMDLLCPFWSRD